MFEIRHDRFTVFFFLSCTDKFYLLFTDHYIYWINILYVNSMSEKHNLLYSSIGSVVNLWVKYALAGFLWCSDIVPTYFFTIDQIRLLQIYFIYIYIYLLYSLCESDVHREKSFSEFCRINWKMVNILTK